MENRGGMLSRLKKQHAAAFEFLERGKTLIGVAFRTPPSSPPPPLLRQGRCHPCAQSPRSTTTPRETGGRSE